MPAAAAERDCEASRRLWSACVLQAISDARAGAHRDEIRRWLDSADFMRLCDLANVDPATARTVIERELGRPVREQWEHAPRHVQAGYRSRRKAPSS